jgi:hypothetical protein
MKLLHLPEMHTDFIFAIIGEDAKAVGRYFYTLDEAYKGNGFDYISDKNMLIPKFGAVFSTISLRDSKIEFDNCGFYLRCSPILQSKVHQSL